jgi:hypothetical protein
LQYHSLLWWAGLRKVREKYHIYIYQWIYWIIKEICIKYNIVIYHILWRITMGYRLLQRDMIYSRTIWYIYFFYINPIR